MFKDAEAQDMDRTQDQLLIAGLQVGDQASLRQLAEIYGPRIHQLAMRHMKNREDAEEVTQDVLFKVHRNVASFRGDSALSSWIYRITFNTAMSRVRTASYRQSQVNDRASIAAEGDESSPVPIDVADWSNMADERILRSELRRRVFRAILALPAIYRAPVMLRDIQGMSTEEASALLRLKDQTLKSRLHRGRVILRKQLTDFAGGLTLHKPCYGC